MSKYQIVRWDVFQDNNNILRPMLYFKPDSYFLNFMKNNNRSNPNFNKLRINIKDTKIKYSDKNYKPIYNGIYTIKQPQKKIFLQIDY